MRKLILNCSDNDKTNAVKLKKRLGRQRDQLQDQDRQSSCLGQRMCQVNHVRSSLWLSTPPCGYNELSTTGSGNWLVPPADCRSPSYQTLLIHGLNTHYKVSTQYGSSVHHYIQPAKYFCNMVYKTKAIRKITI